MRNYSFKFTVKCGELSFAFCLFGINMFRLKLTLFTTIAIFFVMGSQGTVRNLAPLQRYTKPEDNRINYRLPNNTSPKHYDVSLTTNVHKGDVNFNGEVIITIHVDQEGTRNVVVHARQLENFTATLTDLGNSKNVQLKTSYAKNNEFLTLTPSDNSQLEQGKKYKLTIKYEGKLRRDNGGFYLSSYKTSDKRTAYLATTQFESTNARHAFPCYDEPAKRATFTITINHDPSYYAISNMPVDSVKSSEGKTVFLQTPNMPTYLVGFVVSDFKYSSSALNDPPQRVFSRPGTENDQEFSLQFGKKVLAKLAEYFDVPYILPKLYQVAVPDFAAGAMENWGLAIYREELLLYSPKKSAKKTSIAKVIAHEDTHMWFGNLVTIKWWTYLWLKEGFATLFAYLALDWVFPEWDVMQLFIAESYSSAIVTDMNSNSPPMSYYVENPNQISGLYGAIPYRKSACVLFMWQNALTDQVFRRGLRKYLTLNQFSAADDNMLFQAISDAADEENLPLPDTVNVMMGSWTNQGGAPLLIVTRDYETGMVHITQTALDGDENKLWFVPINYATASNSDFRNTTPEFYIKNDQRSIQFEPKHLSENDWLILNKKSTGYYCVQYDENNWELIIQTLLADPETIHPHNRATLINHAYILATKGLLANRILLDLAIYLQNEDQLAPWKLANPFLNRFNLYLKEDTQYNSFKAYVGYLVRNIYERLGIDNIAGEPYFTPEIRTIAINLACIAEIDDCLQATHQKLVRLVEDGVEIEPDLKPVIYCNALKQASDQEFDFLYDRLMTTEEQALRRVLISSLGCAQNPEHIKKFIESSISNSTNVTLRTHERITVLYAAYSRGEPGISVSIDFLSDNFMEYASNFGGTYPLDSDIRQMSIFVTNENQSAKLKSLMKKVMPYSLVSKRLEDDVTRTINRIPTWLKLHRDTIMDWIKDFLNAEENRCSNKFTVWQNKAPRENSEETVRCQTNVTLRT